jgi:hypothetical protein
MKNIFLFLASLFSLATFAQEFAPLGAVWHYQYSPGSCLCDGYVRIESVGDTIIENKNCKVLNKTLYTYDFLLDANDTISYGREFIYYENDTVFNYRNSNFYVLYDFTAQPNDTWLVAGTDICDSAQGLVIVDSIGQAVINGLTLKWKDLSSFNNSAWRLGDRIFEKIGSLGYMFPEPVCIADADYGGALACYAEPGWEYHTEVSDSCNQVTIAGIDVEEELMRFSVFPNPASDYLRIKSRTGEIFSVLLFNNIGLKIAEYKNAQNDLLIDISNLQGGLHSILLISNKHNNSFKIIKQ